MRPSLFSLLLIAILLISCTSNLPQPLPTAASRFLTSASPLIEPTITVNTPTFLSSPSPLTPTRSPTTISAFPVQPGASLPPDHGSLIAFETNRDQNEDLLLADLNAGIAYEFSFPTSARFASPFLAGLSPDSQYFVYFEGGWIETIYDIEFFRLSTPDLNLHVLDLRSGKIIYSAPLLSPSYPQDLEPVAETIKDDWNFTFQNDSFDDVVSATQEFLLNNIRRVAWSPDSSLLAYASQDPGPTSDLVLFSPESGTALSVNPDPGHVIKTVWAPDSAALIYETSLYDRHAREDTTYLLTRDWSLLASFTSQVRFFHHWHDSIYGILYSGTDSGDYFDLQTISTADGSIDMLFEGTYASIAYTPDLTTFLVSTSMPTAPIPPHPGLFLGKRDDDSLLMLSENRGWSVVYWGSEHYPFAASSIDEGTIGVTLEGERVNIDDGVWRLAASPDGSYLAGYHMYHPSYLPGVIPGLRIFDGSGVLIESIENINVACVGWNGDSSALAYQVENSLYVWDAARRSTRLISDKLDKEQCGFMWVQDNS